ncbi:NAD-dependent deacetylase [Acetobacter nitrogenifigens DSM 23921 = NBRC 105050]|uniref:NAD-dependent protein deacetylase n=1 Tax=Acetobacter nitrogenifigens DSM 23921 = NBRC 105050 TaxID=1120919 RepID=A0A511XAX5_9PROT|nr:NAD-dependent protein deacetylase [Acetobacter nitrogenifigens]GBQ88198.1 NAD-dependent deacetylase [Acetobacter nitrogenifigens DSM 23921 = NBRC 105050]GEN60118.1 NAD-dependent protein deacetylase 2 [Acetobacter nitrogenifigens DSM 23921 = NBRC 105050]
MATSLSDSAETVQPASASNDALRAFVDRHQRIFVLTGAGCSTESGIADYRDERGEWKRPQPVTFQAFMRDEAVRRRYWARSLIGWRQLGAALPNAAHRALAALEARGQCEVLLTQNVDGLHQAAGSRNVIDLHGRIDAIRCMNCGQTSRRHDLQPRLLDLNPGWAALDATNAPDGDADLDGQDFSTFRIPPCARCGGVLKPDVVFFGENVPAERRDAALAHLARADAMLVVGSSLMVQSGYRFVARAAAAGLPIASVTIGRTRADALLTLKVSESCGSTLNFLLT